MATSGELVYQFFMQQTISDAHLFGILGALVLLDFLFLTFWTFFHPLRMIQKNVTVEVYCLFGFNGMSSVMQTAPTFKKKITKKKPKKNPNIFYEFYFYATLAPDILMIVVTYEVFSLVH